MARGGSEMMSMALSKDAAIAWLDAVSSAGFCTTSSAAFGLRKARSLQAVGSQRFGFSVSNIEQPQMQVAQRQEKIALGR